MLNPQKQGKMPDILKNLTLTKICFSLRVWAVIGLMGVVLAFAPRVQAGEDMLSAGFLYDKFFTVPEPGIRTEAAGPFFYKERKEEGQTLAFPPFFSAYKNPAVNHGELDVLYPFITYEYYSDEWRLQFYQLLSFAGGQQPDEFHTKRFTIFPIYFQQRSLNTNLNYTAVAPFYGHLKNRLFRDEIFFVMFPLYGQSHKKDIVTDNYFYPFVHVRNGGGLHGWQVWPFAGKEHKEITSQTNDWNEVTKVAGHDKLFAFWPLWLAQDDGIGTDNPETYRASIPLFAVTRSPQRDATSVMWPFFTWVDERGKKYKEWEGPWPFVVFARGEGKTTDRVWPLFSQSHNATLESDSYIWPLYTYKRTHSDPLDWQSTRLCFYLFVSVTEKNTETGGQRLRRDAWPFFIWRKDFDGNTRFQMLAPLESILAENRGIERNWSPLWSLWRAQQNLRAGTSNESFLWNLYRRETAPEHKKISLLFGLFQYEKDGDKGRTRLFYIPLNRK
jgi:hypothetical protein